MHLVTYQRIQRRTYYPGIIAAPITLSPEGPLWSSELIVEPSTATLPQAPSTKQYPPWSGVFLVITWYNTEAQGTDFASKVWLAYITWLTEPSGCDGGRQPPMRAWSPPAYRDSRLEISSVERAEFLGTSANRFCHTTRDHLRLEAIWGPAESMTHRSK